MPAENLMALAALAGNAVMAAASTDMWEEPKLGFARLLGRGDPDRIREAEQRLAKTREQLAAAEGADKEQTYAALAQRWAEWLIDLLEEYPDTEHELRALVQEIQAELLTRDSLPLPALRNVQIGAISDGIVAGRDVKINWSKEAVAGELTGRGIWVSHGEDVGEPIDQRSRYLKGQCPESIPVGEPFSLLVSIVLSGPASVRLKAFDVPPEGRDVLLVLHAPGLRLLGHQRMTIHVPPEGDSEPVMFELQANTPGPRSISVTAWIDGSYLGELLIEISVGGNPPHGTNRDVLAEITMEPANGAVSLVVHYDPRQNIYRFEFRDEDNPEEVTSNLAYEPGPRVEQLVSELDDLAKDHTGYSAAQTRDYLVNAGAGLWQELIPERLRQQFWNRQHRIQQLTILADKDTVPWELLYPMDPGYDAGFLVEQFPVTRAVFGRAPSHRLRLQPARFVLPEGSPPEARAEIEAMRRLLDPEQAPEAVIAALTPLQDLISSGSFGLLHFACHNRFSQADGSSIMLDQRQFTPTLMTTSAINHVLAKSSPTVFINACRTAGLTATYNRLDGWASKFLEAGAAVFIGSLWAVSDGAGREFAYVLYEHLQRGSSLGAALLSTRQALAGTPGDPTWLAYTVYGNPHARAG
jgi:hypothetical protein